MCQNAIEKYGAWSVIPKELKKLCEGIAASRGKALGEVCLITSPNEQNKMKKGAVLVTMSTNPEFTPMMLKASAIVTDYGGIICHAAIVAREFGIPAVVGCNDATKTLKDGMKILVDGGKGVVYEAK